MSYYCSQNHRDRKQNVVTRGRGKKAVRICLMNVDFQFYKRKRILDIHGVDGCTTN